MPHIIGLKVRPGTAEKPRVDVTASSSLNAMAATANDAVDVTMLKKGLDIQAHSMAQLLQTLPTPPQADGKGAAVNTYA
jgi:hypothetical protein